MSARAEDDAALFARVRGLLESRCAMAGCHAGPKPAQGLPLTAGAIYRSTVNVHAHSDGRFLRVVPGAPDRSLLYLKLLAPEEGHYRGPRMPLSKEPLAPEDIALVKEWIESFPQAVWGPPPGEAPPLVSPRTFQDAYLANLPTADPLGAHALEFRIVHRFKASAPDAGSDGLYGLDSGAWIAFDLAFGLTEALDLGLRRTNLDREYEGYGKWRLLGQRSGGSPLSLAFRGGVSNVRERGRVNRTRVSAQAILSRRLGRRLSLMLVPTYVTRTDDLDREERSGTAAVGAGAEWRLKPRIALTGEWVAQTAGVKAAYQSASIGVSMATSGHVFHLLVTNTQGSLTDQYAPGGDLSPRAGDFRLGFNIGRIHTFGR
jgi:hypothetical protein